MSPHKFSIILCNSARARSYIQHLCSHQLYPSEVLLMPGEWHAPYDLKESSGKVSFDIYEPVEITIKKHKLNVILCENTDINSQDSIEKIKKSKGSFVIFGGPGGQILRSPVLTQGKPILHIHPGMVPEFRGSTTIYYSILASGKLGCSAFFFNEKIDEGNLVFQKEFNIIKNIDMDYILDPEIRGITLVEAVQKLIVNLDTHNQKSDSHTLPYFVIHPVLKHIAILSNQN